MKLRRLVLAIAAGLSFLSAAPAIAQGPAEGQITLQSLDSGPIREDVRQLVALIVPHDLFLRSADDAMAAGITLGFGEAATTLDKERPGFTADLRNELMIAARPHSQKMFDRLAARYGRLLTRMLSDEETAVLVRLFSTSGGQKIIAKKYALTGDKETMRRLIGEDVGTSDIRDVNRGVAKDLIGELTSAEIEEFAGIAMDPAFQRLSRLRPIMEKIEVAQLDEPEPELDKVLNAAVARVMKRHGIDR